jgi:hypothetical protein
MLSTHLASSIISTETNACLLKLSELQIDQQTGQLGSKKSPLIWPSSSIFEYQEDDVDQHKMCPPDTVTRGFRQGPWELFKTQVSQGQPQVASDGPKLVPNFPFQNGTKREQNGVTPEDFGSTSTYNHHNHHIPKHRVKSTCSLWKQP